MQTQQTKDVERTKKEEKSSPEEKKEREIKNRNQKEIGEMTNMIQNEHYSPAIFKAVKHLEIPLK